MDRQLTYERAQLLLSGRLSPLRVQEQPALQHVSPRHVAVAGARLAFSRAAAAAAPVATLAAVRRTRHRSILRAPTRIRAMGLMACRDAETIRQYFRGRVVWVTGASGGLGEALSVALCRVAAPRALILSARQEAELERVKLRCLELQPTVEVVVLRVDVSALDTLPSATEKALALFGKIDVLVNNAGVGFRGVGAETSLELDQLVMNTNFFSGVALTKALLPSWLEARDGHVVQISSVQGFFGLPGRTAYSAAKHAAVGFYDSLRAEVADAGVAVTVVCPGYIKTKHSQNAVHSTSAGYPEGHTSKGVSPDVLAEEILSTVARRKPELVSAAFDAKLARLLRTLCPRLLFWVMRRRAQKELRERNASAADATTQPSKDLKGD